MNNTMRKGCVAASHPAAAEAGASILELGGNAADAAIATVLALCVADPANVSFFGRCQILSQRPNQPPNAVNGASRCPQQIPSEKEIPCPRTGYQAAAIPGLPQALQRFHQRCGALPFTHLVAPAIALAEQGVQSSEPLFQLWQTHAPSLSKNPHAAVHYRSAKRHFCQPSLAKLLSTYAHSGCDAIFDDTFIAMMQDAGAYWTKGDFDAAPPRCEETLETHYGDWHIHTLGAQGWGHTLIQLLQLFSHLPDYFKTDTAESLCAMALAIHHVYSERPEKLGTLDPNPTGWPLDALINESRNQQSARRIVETLDSAEALKTYFQQHFAVAAPISADRDTSHLSVLDRDGYCVSLTASIGPHFGTHVADPIHGVLLAHSYRMAHAPLPNAYDVTEMTPSIALGPEGQRLAIGAAGSERIPTAVAQVLVNMMAREMPLEAAIREPRASVMQQQLRLHQHWPKTTLDALRQRGIHAHTQPVSHINHLGIVHAAMHSPQTGFIAAADPAYGGGVAYSNA